LTAVSEFGCAGSDAVTVTVYNNPVVDAGMGQTVCEDEMVTLNGSGAVSYTWDGGITNGVPFVVSVGSTTYTVTGTDANGCSATDMVTVNGKDKPVITAVVSDEFSPYGAAIDLTVTGGSGPFAYDWSHGPTSQDVTGLTAGTYTVMVDDLGVEDGICEEIDSTFIIKSFVGLENNDLVNFNVFPSPTTDNLTIQLNGAFTYEVSSLKGDVILNGTGFDSQQVSLANYANGTYIVKVNTKNMTEFAKVVKQ
jgi:hypothetical protein